MTKTFEVAFTSDLSNQHNNCSVWDLKTGGIIANFKKDNSGPKTLSLVADSYLISGVVDKPLLRVWTLGKGFREEVKFPCPGVVSSIAITPCGTYCVCAIGKNLNVWEIPTGNLLSVISEHYQDITCVRFSDDGSHFISGGKDSMVMVWVLSQIVCIDEKFDKEHPRHIWNHHSSEVVDIFIGSLGIHSRVATISTDQTCKIYEMVSGQMLVSISLDETPSSVAMDAAEFFLFIGMDSGDIRRISFFSLADREVHYSELADQSVYRGHRSKVTCLSVSWDGSILLSGSNDETCKLWSVTTLYCTKTFSHTAPITNAFITMCPLALMSNERIQPKFPVGTFKRYIEAEMQEGLVPVKLGRHHLATYQTDNNDEEFNKAVIYGIKEPGTISKDILLERLKKSETANQQIYTYSLNTFLASLE